MLARHTARSRDDHTCLQIECELELFSFCHSNNPEIAKKELQQYFETNGNRLTSHKELLPYFSIPFIPHPQSNPNFAHLFQNSFVQSLK